jgi:hypothetical protein
MRKIIPVILLCALAGCATDNLGTVLPMLEGQPVSEAVHYLGEPTEKSATTYTWVYDQSGTFDEPTGPSPVVVSGGPGHPVVSFPQQTPTMANSYHWHCRLTTVAENGIIAHTSYEGDAAGCKVFSDKLRQLVAKDQLQ